jgi:hypothetical protein
LSRVQVSSFVTVWDNISLWAVKSANKLEEMAFHVVLCMTVSLQGTHFTHTFEYQRSWHFLCCLKDSGSLSGCDVSVLVNYFISTLQYFWTKSCDRMAAGKQIIELCSSLSEAITLFAQWPTVLLSTIALP